MSPAKREKGGVKLARAYPLIILTAALLTLPACRGPRNFTNENDRLREQNFVLQESVQSLEAALARKDAELTTVREQLDGARPLPGIAAPRLTTVALDRYCGPVDTDGDGRDDVVRLYLKTLDQHGRTLPIEGKAEAKLVLLGDGEDEPTTLVGKRYDAEQLRAHYRSGFTGTHYTFELPLDTAPTGSSTIAARVTLTDAATGVTHEAAGAYTIFR